MEGGWISLADLPAEGREFSFDDQGAWAALFREFRLGVRVGRPLVATFTVVPHKEAGAPPGVLVRGNLTGSVILACSRCTCDVEHEVDLPFEMFEGVTDEDGGASQFLRQEGEQLLLHPGEMLWEEFSLGLPASALCSRDCKGLCAGCGKDLNAEECACHEPSGDPRMAVLRGLKIDRKN